jgi:membrane protease YdiL (CAAX protease family)
MVEPASIVVLLLAAAGVGSLSVLFCLFQKHIDGQPLLAFEPRRPVPWNVLAPLALLAPLAGVALSSSTGEALAPAAEHARYAANALTNAAAGAPWAGVVGCALEADAVNYSGRHDEQALQLYAIWAQAAASLTLTAACYALLVLAFGATWRDLGLPASWTQVRSDVLIGATAFLASLAPIYAIQFILTSLLQPEHVHPLIEELAVNHSSQMLAAAGVAAVVAAPVFEETAFRLTLQGWLERVVDRTRQSSPFASPVTIEPAANLPEVALGFEQHVTGHDDAVVAPLEPSAAPAGWVPILISGVLFGAAHVGHGVAPASLILLGVVLGYLYHRTHRIVPSIVCHMLFNAFSLGMLWLEILTTGG